MRNASVESFSQWRTEARRLIASNVHPSDVLWQRNSDQPSLFGDDPAPPDGSAAAFSVPRSFLQLAEHVACHRDHNRWCLLYRTLWRILNEQRELLSITTDEDVYRLMQMKKAVTRDVHKMKAFVRFRKAADDPEMFVAWHRPDHRIVRLAAPFFARRFKGMRWSIFTPDESVEWNQSELRYGPGVPASEVTDEDALEHLWKTYYASIFNPARVKVAMMKREMPVRHWPTLPESELIPELLRQAPDRVEQMIQFHEGFGKTAAHFMPSELSLPNMNRAIGQCTACDLCHDATQAVFGEGPPDARIVVIGEQPGDREDVLGRPFVGPAGQLMDDCFSSAGISRSEVYLTNTVKHFKYTERGRRRLHKKPSSREIYACRPWLEAELALLRPAVIVCLGATPAQALLGRDFRIAQSRGTFNQTEWCKQTIATWHPAAILRMRDPNRQRQMKAQLIEDLTLVLAAI